MPGRQRIDSDPADEPGPDLDAVAPSWGLGEVALGWFLGMAAATFASVVVISVFGYSAMAPAGIGAAVGQVARDLGTGAVPQVAVPVPIEISALLQVPLWIGLLGVPYLACRFRGQGIVKDLRIRFRWIDAPVGIVVGVATQLALIPALYWLIFKVIGEQDLSEEARQMTDRATGAVGIFVLLAIVGVGAPIAEEVFFRGFMNGALEKRGMSWIVATIITALVFAFTHFQPLQFPALFLFGLILGGLVHWTGRLGPAIVAHSAFNLTAALVLVFGWS